MDRSDELFSLSLLPSKLSSSATLAPLDEWLPVCMFIRMACTTADVAFAAASEMSVWPPWHGPQEQLLAVLELGKLLRLIMEKFV